MAVEYLGLAGAIVVVVHLVAPRRWSVWASVAALALVLGAGVYQTLQARHAASDALERWHASWSRGRDPSRYELDEMRAQGYREALRPIRRAGILAGGLAVLLVIGEVRRRRATA